MNRLQRDLHDGQKMFELFIERDLFEIDPELIHLYSGEVADKSTNLLYKAHDIGEILVQRINESLHLTIFS